MTPKASSWAQRGKEAQAAITTTVPPGFKLRGGGGDLEPIVAFYSYNASRNPTEKSRTFAKGDVFQGTYEGKYESKVYAGALTHKVRTAEGLLGLSGSAQLNKYLDGVATGTEVQIMYKGKEQIKTGPAAGKSAHGFQVAVKEA